MRIYEALSKVWFTKKHYAAKFLLVAFLGIHVPLIGMCIYYMVGGQPRSVGTAVLLLLVLTLVATAATLLVQNKLLQPLLLAKRSLDDYLAKRDVPHLPTHYEDEAGVLLANIHTTIKKLDTLLIEKSGVIDMLSHDLRSPLARIAGLAHIIKIDDQENIPAHTEDIIQECNSTLRLLQHVLETLRQEENQMTDTFIPFPVKLRDVVLGCVVSFDLRVTKKGIKWDVDIDENITINAEPIMFAQALKNILGNAIKFSPANSTIHIYCHTEGDWLMLSVKDEGIGFDPADSEKIFQRFTGSRQMGTYGETSTGLGLHISKKIIERHGGNIIAESGSLSKGATFTIVLPYKGYSAN